jgi:hypothetical protein
MLAEIGCTIREGLKEPTMDTDTAIVGKATITRGPAIEEGEGACIR